MQTIELLSTPFTEHWVGWLMLILLVGVCSVQLLQPGLYVRAFMSIPTTKERDSIFAGSGSDNRSRLVLVVYDILMIALILQWSTATDYSLLTYGKMLICAIAMLFVRFLMQRLVAFTFFSRQQLETFSRHYHYLGDCTMLLLYPVTLTALFVAGDTVVNVCIVIACVLLGAYYLIMLYKLIACFRFTLLSLLYVPLYLLTVEVLPIAGMIVAALFINSPILQD